MTDVAEIRELRKKIIQYKQQIALAESKIDALLELDSPRRSAKKRLDKSQVCELLDAAINSRTRNERIPES